MRAHGPRIVRLAAIGAVCIAATSCRTQGPSPTPAESDRLSSLPCDARRSLPSSGQVTFVAGHRLYAVGSHTWSKTHCMAEDVGAGTLSWGPQGDRVLVGSLESIFTSGKRVREPRGVLSPAISYPTGRSIVYISADHRLRKVPATGGSPIDISFLSRHDEVVYHPAGTHIAVVGKAKDGTYGIWRATNLGKDPQPLTRAETARRLYSLTYNNDGTLYFAADHRDHFDVHSLRPDNNIDTEYSGQRSVTSIVPSPFDIDRLAYGTGSCETRTNTRIRLMAVVRNLGGRLGRNSTRPAGWLPDGRLVVLARAHGCDGPADVYLWSPKKTTRVATNAERTAVRAALPPPPPPPGPPGEANA